MKTRVRKPYPSLHAACGALGLAAVALGACSDSEKSRDGGVNGSLDGGAGGAGDAGAHDGGSLLSDGAVVIEVPADSAVCSVDLPLKPPGCACKTGESAACWTGPASNRNVGDCKDGTQRCEGSGEFSQWGACEGQVLDCGDPPPPPGDACPCVPGEVIGCDEDCAAFVFCAPSSTKLCQPDGKFGPCREAFLPTPDTNLLGCINVFHGCFAENPEGVFTGDCSSAYTCGHAPGGQSAKPPDAGTPLVP